LEEKQEKNNKVKGEENNSKKSPKILRRMKNET
jgi:hypothetical protein